MRFNFSSPLDMVRVTCKYMRIGYGDGECKTCPHPAPLPCLSQDRLNSLALISIENNFVKNLDFEQIINDLQQKMQ